MPSTPSAYPIGYAAPLAFFDAEVSEVDAEAVNFIKRTIVMSVEALSAVQFVIDTTGHAVRSRHQLRRVTDRAPANVQ
jgi:hypothetical protein